MTYKISSDGAAVVTSDTHWIPIDSNTPRGVKLLLVSNAYGVAHVTVCMANEKHYTHWHPLPTFKKETK